MCGICGIIQYNGTPVDRQSLECMTRALAHRGPNGEGMVFSNGAGLGHRRLAIIDLEGGKQPMSNEDGCLWITFNGELYNYRELRRELEPRGHTFRTQSDTEVILHAYETWGESCVEHFRGMFAFAILDDHRHRLFLARDHLGIKPLYYYQDNDRFAFASELQALRCLPRIPLDIDLGALDQYLALQYIAAPLSIFQHIKKLPPAHHLSLSLSGGDVRPQRYWSVQFRPDPTRSKEEWLEALDAVLRDSVKAHLVSDVPFGVFLSGGIDSNAIVAYMAQSMTRPVSTFTIGFGEPETDELDLAESVSKQWKTNHHVEIIRPNAFDILPDLVRYYGEPFGDNSAIPTYYVSKLARAYVPMVLSGDGSDEMFAGYNSYRDWMGWLAYEGVPLWKRLARPFAHLLNPRKYAIHAPMFSNWMQFITYVHSPLRECLWRPEYRAKISDTLAPFESLFAETLAFSNCQKARYMDILTYLPNDILTKVDGAGMRHGLEVRTPFVDVRVVTFAATIPESMNIAMNANGVWEGKLLLKKLMEPIYSSHLIRRPKMGFALPLKKWLGTGSLLRGEVHERILGRTSALADYFDPKMVKCVVDTKSASATWLMLFLEEWLRQNKRPACPLS